MHLKKISLKNFRNYKNSIFEFKPGVNIIIGPNGSGKTNILEAISMLSLGKSYRGGMEFEVINIGEEYAQVQGYYDESMLEINIVKDSVTNRVRKSYKINNVTKSGTQFIGFTKVINFGPEEIRLVAGSPHRRREHLDKMLRQIYWEYNRNLNKYNRILSQRNKLLEKLKGQILHSTHEAQMSVWSEQLIQTGIFLQEMRKTFFQFSALHLGEISKNLYKGEHELSLRYICSELTREKLYKLRDKELRIGTTQIGPHRDDYDFLFIDKDSSLELKSFGSRGQQRTGVLCVKILELKFFEEKSEMKPILLLDDIFSELDSQYRLAINSIIYDQQTIITTADENSIPSQIKDKANIINLH